MIFSNSTCPICKLTLVKDEYVNESDLLEYQYVCPQNVEVYHDDNDRIIASRSHYSCDEYYLSAEMIILPYILRHEIDMTQIFMLKNNIERFIFKIPLLDVNYSQPQIKERLHLLTMFS